MTPPSTRGVSLAALTQIFDQEPSDLGQWTTVDPDAMPQPYRRLLAHSEHMTVTVETHHGSRVNLRVLDERTNHDWYARKILLARTDTDRVVQFGIMRIDFHHCTPQVRESILNKQTPLGRILIDFDVLRRISPETYLRVVPTGELLAAFQLQVETPTYGRLATIFCEGEPAIELLEVVAPEPDDLNKVKAEKTHADG